ncbi:MAG TPA: TonB-dependent receptor [Bryobacteraceae bacterium]|nr:TonB-dependent receptor [Bryobacteraceae bacterium]
MIQRLAIVSVLFLLTIVGRAQTTNASIYGSILDSSGAAIPKANVTATNVKTGVALSTVSNDSGIYIFPSLLPGEYTVSAEVPGFRKGVASSIQLDVSSRISVDLKLEVGTAAETVTVESTSSPLEAVNSSVSNVVSLQKVQSLPLPSLDAGGLIALQPGVIGDNINGVRSQSQNVTLDGVNIQETRYNGGYTTNATAVAGVDLVAEFRVSTAPVDAEFGRGMAQVQMISRSGTNEIHGSAFEFNRVTALSANSWFNNQLGTKPDGSLAAPRNFLIRNQFGVRAAGPIIKNRTFAFFLYEGQRQKTNTAVNDTVLTATARQGIFRYYPGVQNGNATAAVPTVDLNGNPLQPAAATGPLQTVSIFGRDPSRLAADPTGQVAIALKDVPLPNNFQRGDGLNTAGYYWQQPSTNNFNLYDFKIDHTLTQTTRLAFSGQIKKTFSFNGYRGQVYPLQPSDSAYNSNFLYTFSATTNLRPTLLNEFRAGVNYFEAGYTGPFYPNESSVLPHIGNQPFFFTFTSLSPNEYTSNNAPQGRTSPLYQLSDSVTWLKGRHAFKGGVQIYYDSSNGYNSFFVLPDAIIGAGSVAVTNISTINGIGANLTAAQNLLLDLSGSLNGWEQSFNSAGGLHPSYIPGETDRRDWRQREYGGFFKDDWKVSHNLTLNLGVRYEYYSPPFEANGKAVIPANGSAGAFGISGTSYAQAFQPGATGGSLTQLVLVGPRSPNPGTQVYNPQYNTVLPGVGLSWAIDKENKTVFRAGYAMSSDRNSLRNADTEVGSNPGLNTTVTFQSGGLLNLSNVGVPFDPGQALATVPLTDRTQTLRVFDTGLRNQYYQNWNISLQRQITKDSVLSVRYIGTKGTKLLSGVNLDTDVITTNGILQAFNITRAGGQAPLFDQIFNGLTVPGQGAVNGTTVRGSDYARSNSTIASYLANGNVGAFANFINTTATGTNVNGGLLTAAGLPANFISTNPQFANVYLVGNNANSTYHALQVEYDKRFSKGFNYQGSYTWSKALGENELGSTQYYDNNYRNPQNRSFDKRIMTFNRTSVFKSNGIYELPFGKGRAMMRNANRVVDGILGGWKVSGILTWTSGVPFTVTAPVSTFTQFTTGQTPDVTGALSKATGQLQFNGAGACYFCGFKQIPDPSIANLASSIASRSTLFAQTAPGGVVLQNPLPGTLGNLAQTFFTSPNFFDIDASLAKTFRINERFNFELRTDWLNSTNHQDFTNATIDTSIDSTTFGRFTGAGGANNNRIIVLGGRLNW